MPRGKRALGYPRTVCGVRYKTREEHQNAACVRATAAGYMAMCCSRCGNYSDEVDSISRCYSCEDLMCNRCLPRSREVCYGCE